MYYCVFNVTVWKTIWVTFMLVDSSGKYVNFTFGVTDFSAGWVCNGCNSVCSNVLLFTLCNKNFKHYFKMFVCLIYSFKFISISVH